MQFFQQDKARQAANKTISLNRHITQSVHSIKMLKHTQPTVIRECRLKPVRQQHTGMATDKDQLHLVLGGKPRAGPSMGSGLHTHVLTTIGGCVDESATVESGHTLGTSGPTAEGVPTEMHPHHGRYRRGAFRALCLFHPAPSV